MPLPPWPQYEPDEIEAAVQVLRSGLVNAWTGSDCADFEAAFARKFDASHGLTLANGSLALEAALIACEVGEGDDVIVTPRSFMASVSCVMLRQARPVFADVDRDSQNLTVETLEAARTPRTRAAIVVHLAGWPCDMPAIMAWANEHDIKIIEDGSQAHGATIGGRSVGSYGHASAFSFCQDKIMTTGGDGGMMVTNDETMWKRAWSAREHGKSWDTVHRDDHPPGFRWVVESLGSNWRMTGPQAAIGLRQLSKLDDWCLTRRRHTDLLRDRLDGLSAIRFPWPDDDINHACYRAYCFVEPDHLADGWSRDRIMHEINQAGWPCQVGSCPEIYREKVIIDAGYAPAAALPVARELGETGLAFSVHPTIDPDTMKDGVDAIVTIIEQASR
ncbi:MAG: DegT/DnrJ/EryC1/StrS aminotransferase family protein [Phycisphaerales bacterium]|nr:DegT/DnrJ/EryC1/StrS aminotransferase family protein [Phycisphaerales bacterium]